MDEFLRKPHKVLTKLMQLDYSHLKILKLEIYSSCLSLLLVTLFCVHVTRWQYFAVLTILSFLSISFSMWNMQFLLLVSLEKPLNWANIWNGLLLQNNKIVKWGGFVTGIKIFTGNNLVISIVLIWYLPMLNLLSFLPVLTHSRYLFL